MEINYHFFYFQIDLIRTDLFCVYFISVIFQTTRKTTASKIFYIVFHKRYLCFNCRLYIQEEKLLKWLSVDRYERPVYISNMPGKLSHFIKDEHLLTLFK